MFILFVQQERDGHLMLYRKLLLHESASHKRSPHNSIMILHEISLLYFLGLPLSTNLYEFVLLCTMVIQICTMFTLFCTHLHDFVFICTTLYYVTLVCNIWE